ncbi:MAG: hypothetical protein JWR29_1273 [Tardiphaga sp.]|nr:hypothetical protein [Tardiphaga sp.]
MTPRQRIDQLIEGLTDWRGKISADMRNAILAADQRSEMMRLARTAALNTTACPE